MPRLIQNLLTFGLLAFSLGLGTGQAWGKSAQHGKISHHVKATKAAAKPVRHVTFNGPNAGLAEARLIEIYQLIGKADTARALLKAEQLVTEFPTFALAQLVYGDLLSARSRPLNRFGDVPAEQLKNVSSALNELQDESRMRLKALRERPPAGMVPAEFVQLSRYNKHAIAVDADRSRLYLFENRGNGLSLVADYYISVGKLGIEKMVEGDQRTPLGIYFVTSKLDAKNLKDFYGAGALPINYPNELDLKRGKTGGGIWLHGSPPGEFSRRPLASDGCVALANPDLEQIMRTVEVRSTPVLISRSLKWVPPQSMQPRFQEFKTHLDAWLKAKSAGDVNQFSQFYAPDFNNGKTLTEWLPKLRNQVAAVQGRQLAIKDLSLLHWVDTSETMVVTFGEVAAGQRSGSTLRQYWSRQQNQWKIIHEGVIG
ncbi:MAG: hypothetical protein AUJ20_00040 [Comamonadaceae bacterium CG1_02_60_18]|nr:MAG: hypothetical protein AUJ20_00040 [Comamonadaceae bacterium CG1_02_60_18]PIQ51300.1 MAG: hypothetical protein COW02_15475 [Comamonadaceae bacterium CG12_big_fil_rev_8_21_14_0_65_59_15]